MLLLLLPLLMLLLDKIGHSKYTSSNAPSMTLVSSQIKYVHISVSVQYSTWHLANVIICIIYGDNFTWTLFKWSYIGTTAIALREIESLRLAYFLNSGISLFISIISVYIYYCFCLYPPWRINFRYSIAIYNICFAELCLILILFLVWESGFHIPSSKTKK